MINYSSNSIYENKSSSPVKYILFFIVILLIIFMLYHTAINDGKSLTFSNFLDFVSNTPSFKINLDFTNNLISDSWGLFDFLRLFINTIIIIFNLIAFIFTGLANVLSFVLYFIRSFIL